MSAVCRLRWLAGILVAAPLVAQTPAPALSLNHLRVVIDSATFHEIAMSPFILKGLSGVEARAGSITIYGRHTWLEIVAPTGAAGSHVGDVSLALALEKPGAIDQLARHLAATSIPFDTATRTLVDSAGTTPWYRELRASGADSTSTHAAFWVMEYTLAMTQRIDRQDHYGTEDRMRDRFIATHFDSLRLLSDVTGATLALPAGDIAKLSRTLAQWGVPVFPEGEGAVIQIPGFLLHLLPAWERPGVRRLTLSLTDEASGDPTYRFGPYGQLRFGPGRVAVWDFSQP
ncbi:MAG TPA: DUF5829 family protein [Gemmatimonadales bacterium]|jgi:hypothetical protein|nr:DUF5829 family protein [Gemmatimonadales bacterium]